ncbi:MAG TPA: hypothetical protein VHR18_10365 [Solirubrobacterales bacterium]|jgi:hypothetical protein|nr:hypothetical protein [Solirubrobacterales bacterium]
MSILDDAIREHLELKRAHGADEAEVKKLEDEAFGPPQRPGEADAFGEAPTEFLTAPAEVVEEAAKEVAEGRRAPNIADLQEAPPALAPEPSVEEQPAGEHRVITEADSEVAAEADAPEAEEPPKLDGVHTTEEREAIADQPTEMFDVEAEMQSGAEAESPSDEQLLDAEMSEPRLAPVDPIAGIEASAAAPDLEDEELEDDEDDFFSEQRLSEELHNALDAPVTDEHALPPLPAEETDEHALPPPAPASFGQTEEGTAIFDIEEHLAEEDDEGDHGDYEDEGESGEYEAIEPEAAAPAPPAPEASGSEQEQNPYDPDTESHEDVLEDTPDFLEDAPEDDNAWFEQRPPKDFDFDD